MKKMIALLLAALMVFALAACAANQTPADAQTEAPTQQTEAPAQRNGSRTGLRRERARHADDDDPGQ